MIDARADRTELRLRLYDNGFTPLPNKNKLCLMKEWSKLTITPELIRSREWARSGRDKDTGIRCGDVIAIDWDINNAELLGDLLDAVVAKGIIAESPFVRIGRAPREMWLYRTTDKIGKRATGFFRKPVPGESEEAAAAADNKQYEQVEILGGGCQFAAYGQRDEHTAYTWPEKSLLDHKYAELPTITLAQVEAVRDFAASFFESKGLVRKSSAGGTDEGYTPVYDLTDDMVFGTHEFGDMTVAALTGYLRQHPKAVLRSRVDALRPGTSGSMAGMISMVGDDICISDHGSYTSHYLASADMSAAITELGALMKERYPQAFMAPVSAPPVVDIDRDELIMDSELDIDVNIGRALKRFAYMTETNTIADVLENNYQMSIDHFRNLTAPFYATSIGPRGGENFAYLSKSWLEHKNRRNVRRAHMRPDQPVPFYTEDNEDFVNTYRPLTLPDHGDPTVGMDLIRRLLPDPAEAKYFTQWLSYKVQNPDTRGPAIVMVAHDTFGTGRGSLIELMKQMFSRGLVRTVDFQTLTGTGTQGQYNEWLADALLVAINEAQEASAAASRWQTRSSAYEHLKLIVEPGSHELYVKRKGVSNYTGRTSASIVVMTNHLDSLVIPAGDRRFAILANGKPQTPEYFAAFHEWRRDEANIGAFIKELKSVSLEGYNPFEAPPMTQSKRDMIDAGASPIDRAVDRVLKAAPGRLLTRDQLLWKLEDYLAQVSVEFPENWQRMVDKIFTHNTHGVPGLETAMIEGRERIVRQIGRVPFEFADDPSRVREELLKNGPQMRGLGSPTGSSVIDFAARRNNQSGVKGDT